QKTAELQRFGRKIIFHCLSLCPTISASVGERKGERIHLSPMPQEARGMAHAGKLSAVEVTRAKGPAVLHDGGGLYLRISPTGSRSWVFRFQLDGKRRDMGLGPYPDGSLAEARRGAIEHGNQRREGIGPIVGKGRR